MLNLLLADKRPMENRQRYPYCKMAFDGCHFYCCLSRCCEVWKLSLSGSAIMRMETKKPYYALCFDCVERCFWALSEGHRQTVFKLNTNLDEIGSIRIPSGESGISNIAFFAADDMLLLCSANAIHKLSKSGVIQPFHKLDRGTTASCATQMHDNLLIGCSFAPPAPGNIGMFYPNAYFDYLICVPKGFTLNSICVGYDRYDTARLFLLATQNHQYSYLLEYEVCNDAANYKRIREQDPTALHAVQDGTDNMSFYANIII